MRPWIAATLLATMLAPAHQAGAEAGAGSEGAPPALACRVEGYDLALVNMGEVALAAGTVLVWSVPFSRSEGRHALDTPLAPGAMVMLNGALESSYLRPGTPCEVTIGTEAP